MSISATRVWLVTGKGGVGRTTVAAALALRQAGEGARVLLAEIGDSTSRSAPSPLARIFGRDRLPSEPGPVAQAPGRMDAVEADPRRGHERFLHDIIPWPGVARAALSSDALRRLAEVAPSFRELGLFYQLLTWLRAGRHDSIVVDMPATGHALALTGLPELLLRLAPRGPASDALREGQAILADPGRAGAVCVTLPEELPVSETFELIEGLRRDRVPVARVVLNRMPADGFSDDERARVRRSIGEGGPWLGAESFLAQDGRLAAAARLRAGVDVEVDPVSDILNASGLELAEKVAAELAAGFSGTSAA